MHGKIRTEGHRLKASHKGVHAYSMDLTYFSLWDVAEPSVSQDLERGHQGVSCESVKGGFCSHIFFVTFDYSPTHPGQGNQTEEQS